MMKLNNRNVKTLLQLKRSLFYALDVVHGININEYAVVAPLVANKITIPAPIPGAIPIPGF